jgi:hypothetical protein
MAALTIVWSNAWANFYAVRRKATTGLFDRFRNRAACANPNGDLDGTAWPDDIDQLKEIGRVFTLDDGRCVSQDDVLWMMTRYARADKQLSAKDAKSVARLTDVEKVGIGFVWAFSYPATSDVANAIVGAWPPPSHMTPPVGGWPDAVSLANSSSYASRWYKVHAAVRFLPYDGGDHLDSPTVQEIAERTAWEKRADAHDARTARRPTLATSVLEVEAVKQPPTPPRPPPPPPKSVREAGDRLLDEQVADAKKRGVSTPAALMQRVNDPSVAPTFAIRVEHAGTAAEELRTGDLVLRFANHKLRRAINELFAFPHTPQGKRACDWRWAGQGGYNDPDNVNKPIAIFEVVNQFATDSYNSIKPIVRNNKCDAREPAIRCHTDGVFDSVLGDVNGGDLEAGAPLNEKILFHATEAKNIVSILHNGMNDSYSTKGEKYGPGIYLADMVCKSAAYVSSLHANADINALLNLSPAEASKARYMLIFRTMLGCAARTNRPLWGPAYDNYMSSGHARSRIYAPGSNGGAWAAPFQSLVADESGLPQEHVMKNKDSARLLPIAIVAYEQASISGEKRAGRIGQWW